MTGKPTYPDLERRVKQFELEILEHQRKDKVLNEDLIREIKKKRKRVEKELKQVSHGLGERIKELNCLYSISKLRERTDFSLEDILQAILDLIPPAWQYPEITCARIIFNGYEFTTKNYKNSRESSDRLDVFLVISTWASANDWENWLKNKGRQEIQSKIDALLGGKTSYEMFQYGLRE